MKNPRIFHREILLTPLPPGNKKTPASPRSRSRSVLAFFYFLAEASKAPAGLACEIRSSRAYERVALRIGQLLRAKRAASRAEGARSYPHFRLSASRSLPRKTLPTAPEVSASLRPSSCPNASMAGPVHREKVPFTCGNLRIFLLGKMVCFTTTGIRDCCAIYLCGAVASNRSIEVFSL